MTETSNPLIVTRNDMAHWARDMISVGVNCHFALLQRNFGISPLDLFAFSYTPIQGLIRCLNSRLDGVIDGNALSIGSNNGEYLITIEKYGFWFHTYLPASNTDTSPIFKQHSKRIRRLAEKLIADLELGEKYFVYKIADSADMQYANELVAAIQSYNLNNRVLIVDQASNPHELGQLEEVGRNYFVGRLAVLEPLNGQWSINLPCWLSIITGSHFASLREPNTKTFRFFSAEEAEYDESIRGAGGIAIELAQVTTLAADGKIKEAIDRLHELRTLYPAEAIIYKSEMSLLISKGRGSEAVEVGKETLLRFPADYEAEALIDRAFDISALHREAVEYWKYYIDNNAHASTDTILRLVKALEALKEFEEAEAILSARIAASPPEFHLLVNFSFLAEHRDNWHEVTKRWRNVEEHFPDFEGGYTGQARAFARAGNTNSALAALHRGLLKLPGSRPLLQHLGWIHEVRNDEDGMIKAYDRYEALFPDDPIPFQRRGDVHRRARRWQDADSMISRGLALHPTHPGLLEVGARLAADRGNWEAALTLWDIFHNSGNKPAITHRERAFLLRRAGRIKDAEAVLREADRLYPEQSQNLADLADTAVEAGDIELALERWHHFRQRFPNDAGAAAEIAKLSAVLEQRPAG
jgi:tetratricopeptide (TPR) repeat protein